MSKYKIDPDEKIMTVRGILDGKETQRHAAARLGVAPISVRQWIANYQSGGSDAFNQRCYKRYPKELKEKAVLEYLNGEGSLLTICQKYGIKASRIQAEGQGVGNMFSEPDWNRVAISTLSE